MRVAMEGIPGLVAAPKSYTLISKPKLSIPKP